MRRELAALAAAMLLGGLCAGCGSAGGADSSAAGVVAPIDAATADGFVPEALSAYVSGDATPTFLETAGLSADAFQAQRLALLDSAFTVLGSTFYINTEVISQEMRTTGESYLSTAYAASMPTVGAAAVAPDGTATVTVTLTPTSWVSDVQNGSQLPATIESFNETYAGQDVEAMDETTRQAYEDDWADRMYMLWDAATASAADLGEATVTLRVVPSEDGACQIPQEDLLNLLLTAAGCNIQ